MRHPDILDEQEQLRTSFWSSLAFHGGIAAIVGFWGALGLGSVEHWGDPTSLGGGAVGITPVNRIPLPTREGRVNPVANDTESQVPSAPAKPKPRAPEKAPDPAAVALRSKKNDQKPVPATTPQRYSPVQSPKPNQVYSSTGQAATTPLYSLAPGGGGVGSGSVSPFGTRFAAYERLLRDIVARNWQSQQLDSRIRNRVAVTFEIQRNGTIRNIRISQSSGNFTMDQSAQRAIFMSNPVPPLPREYERDVAGIEFWFGLQ